MDPILQLLAEESTTIVYRSGTASVPTGSRLLLAAQPLDPVGNRGRLYFVVLRDLLRADAPARRSEVTRGLLAVAISTYFRRNRKRARAAT